MLFPNSSRLLFGSSLVLLSLGTLIGYTPQVRAISITFDYTYDDDHNFFGSEGSQQRLRLEEAASYFTGFTDQLSSLSSNTYNNMPDPAGSGTVNVTTAVGQNEIKIYAGGDPNLSSIGNGGSFFGSENRGQTGSPTTDFAPLIGFISFDSDANWHFGDKNNPPPQNSSDNDFLSVAIHEIAHVMGFGIAPSWNTPIVGNQFTGDKSVEINGGSVTLYSDGSHWAQNTMSQVNGVSQEAALDPDILVGTRKFLTDLDYAGLEDIGWEVDSSVYSSNVPFEFSPSLGILVVAGVFGTKKVWNARKAK